MSISAMRTISLLCCLLVSLLLLLPTLGGAQDITSNLTLRYQLNETSGTTATDAASTPHNGALTLSGDWRSGATCKIAGCLAFSSSQGTQEVVGSGATLSNLCSGTVCTMALWFQATGTPPDEVNGYDLGRILSDQGRFYGFFWGRINTGTESIHLYHYDTADNYISQAYTQGTWVHLAWVHATTTVSFYVNGTLVNTISQGATGATAGDLHLGGSVLSTACTTLCLMDDVRVYNRALTSGDIAALAAFTGAALAKRRAVIY